MGLDVTAETTIRADRERVATYAMDYRNDPIWIGGITEAELLGDPPIEKGSQVRRVAHFLGKRIDYVLEVAELEPGSRMAMRSVRAPFPMAVTYGFEGIPGGTRASIRVEGEAKRRYGPLWLTRMMVKRGITKDLERLKRILES